MSQYERTEIIRRSDLDFGLDDEDIPRYWYEGDPFKTRFFDAMSLLFPEGEKFFIACVRDYKDQVEDPELAEQVKDFTFQEGQHGMVHTRFNQRLERQGVNVPKILEEQKKFIAMARSNLPSKFTLAETAAAEHMTAIMAESILNNPDRLKNADPRIRAMYYWHAIEETEHKAVAFDVLQKVAGAGYFTRIGGMLAETIIFPLFIFVNMAHMFRVDGLESKWKIWFKGLWWLYGPRGVFTRMLPAYFRYYLPGFHPWKKKPSPAFNRWLTEYEHRGGDPVAATDRFIAAA